MDFRVLGSLEVDAGDGPVPLGGAKQRTVLAHLVLRAGTLVTAERLIDAVWEDEPPAAARNVVQTYVSRLRKVLGPDRLTQRAGGYVLHAADEEIDARRLASLVARARAAGPDEATHLYREADALWRGPALADLADQPSLRAEIQSLEDLRLTAAEERVVADLALGRHAEVVPELEELTARNPVRESLWAHLMLALYRSGRQADALAAYRSARSILMGELGLEPGARLRRLEQQVLRHDPALDAPRGARGLRLQEPLGSGSAGVVHRAVQARTGREVAVKVIGPSFANDPGFIQRFEVDSQRLVRLEHPHVVPVYDAWREPDGAFVVMRLLRGGNLRDHPVPPERTLAVAEQLCSALVAAHRQGVVHGNIRPTNVLLDEEGNAYLSDFSVGNGDPADTPADVVALGRVLSALARPDGPEGLAEIAEQAVSGAFSEAVALATALSAPALPVSSRNPYKGLRPFLEPDAPDFDGRNELVTHLVKRLKSERLLALVGPSGCGKSSVVRAGLLPALRAQGCFVADLQPGDDPFAALAEALTGVLPTAPADLSERLAREARVPTELLPGELVLVVDQFEELFPGRAPDASRFLDLVRSAIGEDGVRVVLTLRADVLDRPLADPAFAPVLREATELVLPLSAEELGEAIVGPARRAGMTVEPGLLASLVADVRGQPGALPLLQFTLAELFDRRDAHGVLTAAAYRELGGVAGAVARGAEEMYADLGPSGQAAARQLLLRLVDAGHDGFSRRRVRRGELIPTDVDQADAEEVIAAFHARRLLAFDRDPETREPTVEIAHDALLASWARLRGWAEEVREVLQEQERVAVAARDWEAGGHDASFLLRGARLERAESLVTAESGRERDFLAASTAERERVAAAERRSVRRLRALTAVLAAGVVVAAVLAVVAFDQRAQADRERRVAVVRELAAAAVADLDVDAERSVLLALAAVDQSRVGGGEVLPEAVDALHRAIGASRIVMRVPGVGGALDWSPEGSMFLTEGPEESGLVEIRDATTGEVLRSFRGHDVDVNLGAFSADGSRLATSGDDGAVQVWDPRTGAHVERLGDAATGQVWGVSFSPDGDRVAAAYWDDGRVRIFDVHTGREVVDVGPSVVGFPGLTTAFSPDGHRLVVPNFDGGAAVIDTGTGRRLLTVGGVGSADADYSPDGRWISLSGPGPTVRVHEASTGRLVHTVTGHRGDVVQTDWSPDGQRLASSASDGIAKVWDVGAEGVLSEAMSISASETGGGIWVSFGPDGSRLMTGDQGTTAVKVWDVSPQGTAEWSAMSSESTTPSVAFLPDGSGLAVGGAGLRLLDSRHGTVGATFREVGPAMSVAAGAGVVSALSSTTVTAWDVDGSRLFQQDVSSELARSAWSPDGQHLAVIDWTAPVTVSDRSGTQLATFPHEPGVAATSVALSPNGRLLAVGALPTDRGRAGGGRIVVRDWRRGAEVLSLARGASALSFAPEGDRLAAAYEFGPPRIWDIGTGRELVRLTGHTGTVTEVEFSPRGDLLATASSDGTVRLWDGDGQLQQVLTGHDGEVTDVSFSPDGTQLATASLDGTTRVWALDVDDLVGLARRELTRGLTDLECERFPAACG